MERLNLLILFLLREWEYNIDQELTLTDRILIL